MKVAVATVLTLFIQIIAHAQVINTATLDTTGFKHKGKVSVEGYIDAYYAYDFNKPSSGKRPYFVSMSRHNEMTINLAFIGIRYSSSRVRGSFIPGVGTYMYDNYAQEPAGLRNIVEAYAGVRLWQNKNIWMDVGVFGSPYTNESAISKDHHAYTRSFAPEYVPYYLSGVKFSVPVSAKVNAYFYLLNGWQQIQDVNSNKSIGTQLEYRPNDYLLINWNTYIGNERSDQYTNFGTRYFTDLFFIYTKGKWSATSCYYLGIQERNSAGNAQWWQANVIGRFNVTEKISITGRVEYFNDADEVQISPITGVSGFSTYSSSLGVNLKLADNILLRAEGRTFQSSKEVYERNGKQVTNSNLLAANVTLWF